MELAAEIRTPERWRLVAVIAAAFATLELVLILGLGAKVVPSLIHHAAASPTRHVAAAATTTPVAHHAVKPLRVPAVRTIPIRPRRKLSVLVLNGNGVAGAAGTLAIRLKDRGYRKTLSTNAPSHNYARSIVLFAPGYLKEAERLGRDAGIRTVATGDGRLRGYRLLVILGGR